MFGCRDVDCDRGGQYDCSSLDSLVADYDLCDRRLDRLHGGFGRRELGAGPLDRVRRCLGVGAHRHANLAATGNRLKRATLPITDRCFAATAEAFELEWLAVESLELGNLQSELETLRC